MSSKKSKMLPDININRSNMPASKVSTDEFFGNIYSKLEPRESTNIQITRNRDNSATIRCPDMGSTVVKRQSGNDVIYSYKPKR